MLSEIPTRLPYLVVLVRTDGRRRGGSKQPQAGTHDAWMFDLRNIFSVTTAATTYTALVATTSAFSATGAHKTLVAAWTTPVAIRNDTYTNLDKSNARSDSVPCAI